MQWLSSENPRQALSSMVCKNSKTKRKKYSFYILLHLKRHYQREPKEQQAAYVGSVSIEPFLSLLPIYILLFLRMHVKHQSLLTLINNKAVLSRNDQQMPQIYPLIFPSLSNLPSLIILIRFLMNSLKISTIMQFQLQNNPCNILSMSESDYSLEQQSDSSVKRPYNRVTPQEKQNLFREVFTNQMKITKAARKLGLNLSTAKFLIKRYKKQHNIVKKRKGDSSNTPPLSVETTHVQEQTGNSNGFYPFYYIVAPTDMPTWYPSQTLWNYGMCYPSL